MLTFLMKPRWQSLRVWTLFLTSHTAGRFKSHGWNYLRTSHTSCDDSISARVFQIGLCDSSIWAALFGAISIKTSSELSAMPRFISFSGACKIDGGALAWLTDIYITTF